MIGKIITGASFRGCLQYCLNDKKQEQKEEQVMKDRAEILLFNQCYGNAKELIAQFNEVRQLNPRLSKPVLHITLSMVPGELLSKQNLMEISQDCARELGFEKNQFVAIHHKDTTHQHIHIVANRIGFDGRTVSDSNNYKRMAQYCRKMEKRFGLQEVLSPRQFLPKEQQSLPRLDRRKQQLKRDLQQVLSKTGTYDDFERGMRLLGYQVIKGRGIAFRDQKDVYTKGSEVGFSLMQIEKILSLRKKLETLEAIEKMRLGLLSRQGKENAPSSPAHQTLLEKRRELSQNGKSAKELHNHLSGLLQQLMKVEKEGPGLPPELLQKKRRKKDQRPSL